MSDFVELSAGLGEHTYSEGKPRSSIVYLIVKHLHPIDDQDAISVNRTGNMICRDLPPGFVRPNQHAD